MAGLESMVVEEVKPVDREKVRLASHCTSNLYPHQQMPY